MLIQLKQKQIEAALRGYIIKMGIDLKGRTLDITFVSGRKDNGLTADISFEDFPMEDDEPTAPVAEAAPPPPKDVLVKRAADPEPAPAVAEPKEEAKPAVKAESFFEGVGFAIREPEEPLPQEVSAPFTKSGVSLFN